MSKHDAVVELASHFVTTIADMLDVTLDEDYRKLHALLQPYFIEYIEEWDDETFASRYETHIGEKFNGI